MAIHLSGTIRVPISDLERVRAALPEHKRLTLAEPGCMAFSVEERNGGVFAVNETFVDEAALAAHQARIRGTAWAEASATAVRDYRTWQD
ncbi:MAG: antibiotic biosynthesis monooxygenase [Hyphomonadaceae bacterium]